MKKFISKPFLFLIFIFSISISSQETIRINNVSLEIIEKTSNNITSISYFLSEKDQKKICKGKIECNRENRKFWEVFGTRKDKTNNILLSSCSSRSLYDLDRNIHGDNWNESRVGVTYRCTNSFSALVEEKVANENVINFRGEDTIKINDLSIAIKTKLIDGCRYKVLSFSGPINEDSTEVIERLLNSIENCTEKNLKEEIPLFVFMNSGGGLLKDGFLIGRLFKDNNVYTVVPRGATCASSCTTAFLGGTKRFMQDASTLLFHAPYTKQINQYGKVGINCQSNNQNLEQYYMEMLGSGDGDFLYQRTMDFCSARDGWKINRGASRLFGIIEN